MPVIAAATHPICIAAAEDALPTTACSALSPSDPAIGGAVFVNGIAAWYFILLSGFSHV
jgi:hypothetical protein